MTSYETLNSIAQPSAPSAVEDCDDDDRIGIEDFSRRIQADNDERYGDIIREANWTPVGEPGW